MCAGSTPVGGTIGLLRISNVNLNTESLRAHSHDFPAHAARSLPDGTIRSKDRTHARKEPRRFEDVAQGRKILRSPGREEYALDVKWRWPRVLTALQLIRPSRSALEVCEPQLIEKGRDIALSRHWSRHGLDRGTGRGDRANLRGHVRSPRRSRSSRDAVGRGAQRHSAENCQHSANHHARVASRARHQVTLPPSRR
jgi:hypothetical protein